MKKLNLSTALPCARGEAVTAFNPDKKAGAEQETRSVRRNYRKTITLAEATSKVAGGVQGSVSWERN